MYQVAHLPELSRLGAANLGPRCGPESQVSVSEEMTKTPCLSLPLPYLPHAFPVYSERLFGKDSGPSRARPACM